MANPLRSFATGEGRVGYEADLTVSVSTLKSMCCRNDCAGSYE